MVVGLGCGGGVRLWWWGKVVVVGLGLGGGVRLWWWC